MRPSANSRLARTSVAAAGISALVLIQVAAAGNGSAASPLPCKATVSTHHPHQYSDVYVNVKTAKHAKVRTTANYKTTSTSHSRHADRHGRATIDYYISDATPGYKVHVVVTVRKSGRTGSCSAWFTPRS